MISRLASALLTALLVLGALAFVAGIGAGMERGWRSLAHGYEWSV